jgi:hypothetical protein
MIPYEKLREIAASLVEKSEKNQVHWRELGVREGIGYEVPLADSLVQVIYQSPKANPDTVSLCIVGGPQRKSVGTLVGADVPEDQSDWLLLKSLFDDAHRAVTHWDKVLDSVERALKTEGVIGFPDGPEEEKEKHF